MSTSFGLLALVRDLCSTISRRQSRSALRYLEGLWKNRRRLLATWMVPRIPVLMALYLLSFWSSCRLRYRVGLRFWDIGGLLNVHMWIARPWIDSRSYPYRISHIALGLRTNLVAASSAGFQPTSLAAALALRSSALDSWDRPLQSFGVFRRSRQDPFVCFYDTCT